MIELSNKQLNEVSGGEDLGTAILIGGLGGSVTGAGVGVAVTSPSGPGVLAGAVIGGGIGFIIGAISGGFSAL